MQTVSPTFQLVRPGSKNGIFSCLESLGHVNCFKMVNDGEDSSDRKGCNLGFFWCCWLFVRSGLKILTRPAALSCGPQSDNYDPGKISSSFVISGCLRSLKSLAVVLLLLTRSNWLCSKMTRVRVMHGLVSLASFCGQKRTKVFGSLDPTHASSKIVAKARRDIVFGHFPSYASQTTWYSCCQRRARFMAWLMGQISVFLVVFSKGFPDELEYT